MKKAIERRIYECSLYLLALYFIYEGLQNIFDNDYRAKKLNIKIYNTESYVYNNISQNIRFYDFFTAFTNIFLFLYGFTMLVSGCATAFFDDKETRNQFLIVLLVLQVVEAFVIHNPFIETQEMRTRDYVWFSKTLVLGSCLVSAMLLKQ